ncbi:hypothetical protein [Rhodanobacter glycinis]|uniref:hypothetical protein n=1 Tax=Rhodanobacter glycinis TaxID=582702 RepID=UPI00112BF5BA|nr:hypothetical protein [Rhodanobacter glycinis]
MGLFELLGAGRRLPPGVLLVAVLEGQYWTYPASSASCGRQLSFDAFLTRPDALDEAAAGTGSRNSEMREESHVATGDRDQMRQVLCLFLGQRHLQRRGNWRHRGGRGRAIAPRRWEGRPGVAGIRD